MRLKFLNPDNIERNVKVSIHKSGKMGFTLEASRKMELTTEKTLSFAINEDDPDDKNLYVVVNSKNTAGFPILKAGEYFYVNTTSLLDMLGVDYKKISIFYDIEQETIQNSLIYKFKRREKTRKQKGI